MNPLQVTNLCSTRRHVASAVAKAIQIEAGDHRQLPPDHVALSTRCCSAAFHGGSRQAGWWQVSSSSSSSFSFSLATNACGTNARHKGQEFSPRLDYATPRLRDSTRYAAAVKLKHQLKHFGITLHQQNILYIYTIYHNIVCHAICMFNGGKLKVIVTFLQRSSIESVCLRLGLKF